MDIEIKNAILHLQNWKETKGFNKALKEAVAMVEKIVDERSTEKLVEYADSRKGN